jgi:hypothetical protein
VCVWIFEGHAGNHVEGAKQREIILLFFSASSPSELAD